MQISPCLIYKYDLWNKMKEFTRILFPDLSCVYSKLFALHRKFHLLRNHFPSFARPLFGFDGSSKNCFREFIPCPWFGCFLKMIQSKRRRFQLKNRRNSHKKYNKLPFHAGRRESSHDTVSSQTLALSQNNDTSNQFVCTRCGRRKVK